MRNNNHHLKYRPYKYQLSHARSIATTVNCCNGTQESSGHGLGMPTPTVHKKVGFLATYLSSNISANVRFGLEEQAESLMKIIEQGRLPDGSKPVFSYAYVTTGDLNAFNCLTESTFGITGRSEANRYSNRRMNANNLVIKEIEGEPY